MSNHLHTNSEEERIGVLRQRASSFISDLKNKGLIEGDVGRFAVLNLDLDDRSDDSSVFHDIRVSENEEGKPPVIELSVSIAESSIIHSLGSEKIEFIGGDIKVTEEKPEHTSSEWTSQVRINNPKDLNRLERFFEIAPERIRESQERVKRYEAERQGLKKRGLVRRMGSAIANKTIDRF